MSDWRLINYWHSAVNYLRSPSFASPSVSPHAHDWFRNKFRQGNQVDVYDCACGARRIGPPGIHPDDAIEPPPGWAPYVHTEHSWNNQAFNLLNRQEK